MSARFFGKPIKRVEDPRLLTGRGRYADDIKLPGMLHAAFVRSPYAHAKVLGVDAEQARAVEGVRGVFRMEDFGGAYAGKRMPLTFPNPLVEQPITQAPLAIGEVYYVGEAVVMVVANSRYVAEDAASLVDVDYDPLPAVVDCRAALRGAVAVHDGAASNVVARLSGKFGDAAGAFRRAAHVFADQYTMHRGGCHSMECRGVIAQQDPGTGLLTIWTSTQSPYAVRRFVAEYLGLEEGDVRVVAPDVGGGFGPKAAVYPEEFAVPLAARALGRPVKWIEDRKEHFVATNQQRDQVWDVEIAADADGRVLAIRGHAVHDNGAYVPYGILLPLTSLTPLPGPYRLEALDVALDVVFTNATPTSPVRGAGRPYAAFVLERVMDRVARELGLDRAEVRRRNYIGPGQMPYQTGMKYRDGSMVTYDSGDYPQCLEAALELADYASFETRRTAALLAGRRLGIGMASYIEDTGVGPYEGATVRVQRTGRVLIETGAPSQGQGHATIFAQICAEQLGVDLSDVTVVSADTGRFPMGIGAVGSRIAVTAGSSVFQAAATVRDKAIKLASGMMEVGENDLELRDGAVRVVGVPEMKILLGELAAALISTPGTPLPPGFSAGLEGTSYFAASSAIPYANGTTVVEVEVDIHTGRVGIVRYSVAHDCGTLINPMLVDGQIAGGAVHGIGNALYERMVFSDEGQPLTTNYGEYLLPIASEMPQIAIRHIQTASPLNPLGAKGAGEGGTIPAAPAIISAIEDALREFGSRLSSHPVSPQEIVALIRPRRSVPAL